MNILGDLEGVLEVVKFLINRIYLLEYVFNVGLVIVLVVEVIEVLKYLIMDVLYSELCVGYIIDFIIRLFGVLLVIGDIFGVVVVFGECLDVELVVKVIKDY